MLDKNNTQELKGGEQEMEIVEVISKGYIETCPICKEKLKPAKSESQAKWNLKVHIQSKHPKEFISYLRSQKKQ